MYCYPYKTAMNDITITRTKTYLLNNFPLSLSFSNECNSSKVSFSSSAYISSILLIIENSHLHNSGSFLKILYSNLPTDNPPKHACGGYVWILLSCYGVAQVLEVCYNTIHLVYKWAGCICISVTLPSIKITLLWAI